MNLPNFRTDPRSKNLLTWLTCLLVVAIGFVDFRLSASLSLEVFYFAPVALAVVARGRTFALVIAVACVLSWVAGDFAAGVHFSSWMVPAWNGAITLTIYSVLIWLLSTLLDLRHDLEQRVAQRTAALAGETAERERLEKNILEVSERERRRIGHDLHDGLGQHLTGTAITAQLLAETLHDRTAAEAGDARKIVGLIKVAIAQTRTMATGLLLADIHREGLASALLEFCNDTARQSRIECTFRNEAANAPPPADAANHLFRIAQEAVRNAVRHGGADEIEVSLRSEGEHLALTVLDNGSGLPPPAARGDGLGLRIMAHRALMIRATFAIEALPDGGTMLRCSLPLSNHD